MRFLVFLVLFVLVLLAPLVSFGQQFYPAMNGKGWILYEEKQREPKDTIWVKDLDITIVDGVVTKIVIPRHIREVLPEDFFLLPNLRTPSGDKTTPMVIRVKETSKGESLLEGTFAFRAVGGKLHFTHFELIMLEVHTLQDQRLEQ